MQFEHVLSQPANKGMRGNGEIRHHLVGMLHFQLEANEIPRPGLLEPDLSPL